MLCVHKVWWKGFETCIVLTGEGVLTWWTALAAFLPQPKDKRWEAGARPARKHLARSGRSGCGSRPLGAARRGLGVPQRRGWAPQPASASPIPLGRHGSRARAGTALGTQDASGPRPGPAGFPRPGGSGVSGPAGLAERDRARALAPAPPLRLAPPPGQSPRARRPARALRPAAAPAATAAERFTAAPGFQLRAGTGSVGGGAGGGQETEKRGRAGSREPGAGATAWTRTWPPSAPPSPAAVSSPPPRAATAASSASVVRGLWVSGLKVGPDVGAARLPDRPGGCGRRRRRLVASARRFVRRDARGERS